MAGIELKINGKLRAVQSDPSTPLLWVLRDELGLTGTKYACGLGICGACTVLVDGAALQSCITAISAVAGKAITTIEGLAAEPNHPIPKAWLAHDVSQCGYCQPAQQIAAAGLLKSKPKPTDADIDAAMSPVLCRCGTYPRIRKAIHSAAQAGTKGG